jgi:hypothetical protein
MQTPENDNPQVENNNAQEAVSESKTVSTPALGAPPHRTADKRAVALLAKKKQRRAAHRVTLRRSHTKG